MTRRPVVVAAWLWAIVAMLWVGRASYAVVTFLGADVVVGALALVAVAVAAMWIRRGSTVRAHAVTDKAPAGS